jgi:membrane-bound lytic murein transglycosylase B
MYKKIAALAACAAAAAFLLAGSVQAADDEGEGGGATANAEQIGDICKDQAAKRGLSASEAEDYLKQCAAPISEVERSATTDRQEGKL